MKKVLIFLWMLVLFIGIASADATVIPEGYLEKGSITLNNEKDIPIGNILGKNLDKNDITAKGVDLNKEKGFSTFIFKDEGAKICIKGDCFENVESKPDGPPSTIKLDENGEILIADFKTDKNGGIYTIKGSTFEAPPNSRIYYSKEKDSHPNVKLEKNSKMNLLPSSEKYSTLKGEVNYEGENFKIGDNEIRGIGTGSGKVSFSDGKITKVGGNTNAIVNGVQHKTFEDGLNLYYSENFDASNHLSENYFNYGKNKIWLGGESFTSVLEEDNQIFPSMKGSGKGQIGINPQNGQLELTENSAKSGFDIKSKGNFQLTNKELHLFGSQDSLNMAHLSGADSGRGYDFNIDEKYFLKEGILSSAKNSNLKININDPAQSTIDNVNNLDKRILAKIKQEAQEKFGIRPRDYLGYINSNEEKKFAQWVYDATERANQNNKGVKVTPAEIYSTAMLEGALLWMNKYYYPNTYDKNGKLTYNPNAPVNGFNYLGTDVIGTPSEIKRLVAGGFVDSDIEGYRIIEKNEKGQLVQSAVFQDMPTGLKAFAGVYAERKYFFETDFKKIYGEAEFNKLSDDEKYFWTTIYYNAGMSAGKDFLTGKRGPGREEYYTPWKGEEKTGVSTNAQYNALLRVSTYSAIKNTCVLLGSC